MSAYLNIMDDDFLGLVKNPTNKKWNFRGKKILLTYPTHLDKPKLINYLAMLDDIDLYRVWHEIGPKDDYLHTHVQIRYVKQRNIKKISHWDYVGCKTETNPNGHPNHSFINTDVHWNNVCGYNKEKDNKEPDPDEYRNFDPVKCRGNLAPMINRILQKRSWTEVLIDPDTAQYCSTNKNYCEDVFNSKTLEPYPFPHKFHPWQEHINTYLSKPPGRHVYWFWSVSGGVGKTDYCDWITCETQGHIFANDTKHADAMYAFMQSPSKLVCFDFPRSARPNYVLLESFKRRVFFCAKYKSKRMRLEMPHVLVFANEPPSQQCLEDYVDRYIVHEIKPEIN